MSSRRKRREGYIGSDGRCPLKLVVDASFWPVRCGTRYSVDLFTRGAWQNHTAFPILRIPSSVLAIFNLNIKVGPSFTPRRERISTPALLLDQPSPVSKTVNHQFYPCESNKSPVLKSSSHPSFKSSSPYSPKRLRFESQSYADGVRLRPTTCPSFCQSQEEYTSATTIPP